MSQVQWPIFKLEPYGSNVHKRCPERKSQSVPGRKKNNLKTLWQEGGLEGPAQCNQASFALHGRRQAKPPLAAAFRVLTKGDLGERFNCAQKTRSWFCPINSWVFQNYTQSSKLTVLFGGDHHWWTFASVHQKRGPGTANLGNRPAAVSHTPASPAPPRLRRSLQGCLPRG